MPRRAKTPDMLWRVPRPLPAGFIEPWIPSRSTRVPVGPDWVHEIKHDGYRLIVRRDGPPLRRVLVLPQLKSAPWLTWRRSKPGLQKALQAFSSLMQE